MMILSEARKSGRTSVGALSYHYISLYNISSVIIVGRWGRSWGAEVTLASPNSNKGPSAISSLEVLREQRCCCRSSLRSGVSCGDFCSPPDFVCLMLSLVCAECNTLTLFDEESSQQGSHKCVKRAAGMLTLTSVSDQPPLLP